MKVLVAQCLTLCDPMNCSPPGSSDAGVGCHFLLQRIFLNQGSNRGLLHGRPILYCLSHHLICGGYILRLQWTPETHSLYVLLPILTGGCMPKMDTVDKGMIHTLDRTGWDGTRLHRTTQSSMRFKTHELFISGIFHLICWVYSWLWVTNHRSKTLDKRGLLTK